MGQTLTHGVYLPSEGERNCYNGLASNWRLLDGAIGTVAAHTTAIAGKADISHTHGNITNDGKVGTTANLPLITGTGGVVQAGAFGNQANTFCEGNDSRLSDARTPVAHTHTKSDVTDLFNTDNTYSANQNFKNSGWEQGVTPANLTSLYLQFVDKNNSSFGAIGFHQNSDGYTFLNILAGDKYANGAKSTNGSLIRNQFRMGTTSAGVMYQSFDGYWGSSLTPLANNTYDLGTTNNKWKSLNGINPGGLSLPTTDSTKWVDLSGSIVVNSSYTYTPTVDGWVSVELNNNANYALAVYIEQSAIKAACFGNAPKETGGNFYGSACIPVRANIAVKIYTRGSASVVSSAYFMPCEGNV